MKRLPWLRLYSRTIDDPKLKLLAFEDRWHFIAILCLKSQGVLDTENTNIRDRMIAAQLGLSANESDEVRRRLLEVGLIDSEWQPVAWDDLQFNSDNSTRRVQKYREKQQHSSMKRSCNVSVTGQETETETETDKETTSTPESLAVIPPKRKQVPYQKIVDKYHAILPALPVCKKITPKRQGYMKARWADGLPDLEHWESFFKAVSASDFLMGKTQAGNGRSKPFIADFEWLINPTNYVKILEGKYHGR